MKRKYKEGDWIRISLDAHMDALGVIARACRSRLFGYFFAVPAAHTPAHDDLKRLRVRDAAASSLFGGAPIEESRWKVIATSVPFDREAWPFPQFVSRGAFGRVWTRRIYDPDTMQVRETETIDETAANGAPDARFATADELEDLLRERICGATPHEPLGVYEVRAGFEPAALQILTRGGRVQFSEPLAVAELQSIARFIEKHPDVELRVHGFSTHPFDVRSLRCLVELRALALDALWLEHLHALAALSHLHRLRIGARDRPVSLSVLPTLTSLRELEAYGRNTDVTTIAQCAQLERLTLIDTPEPDLQTIASAPVLRELTLAHTTQTHPSLERFTQLTHLELRDMPLCALPDLSHNLLLETVVLRNVREVRDLTPLTHATALRRLEILGSPQFNVDDFKPLMQCAQLRHVRVDLRSRRKTREVYRLLHLGTKPT